MDDPAGNASKIQHHKITLTLFYCYFFRFCLLILNLIALIEILTYGIFDDHQPVRSWKVS